MSMPEQSQTHQNHTTMDRDGYRRWRSSMVEQLICNQQVAGSSPIASSVAKKETIAWTKPSVARRRPSREGMGTVSGVPSESDGFPSGQREQTVNLSPLASKVRILPRPPEDKQIEGRHMKPVTQQSAGVAQLVELQPSKLVVAGSRPVSRSTAHVAQLAEHVLGKDEVTRSIRVVGSRQFSKRNDRVGGGELRSLKSVAGGLGPS